jgi:GGDEF domain-containing protein
MALSGAQRSSIEAMLTGSRSSMLATYDGTTGELQRKYLQDRVDRALRASKFRTKAPTSNRDLLLLAMLLEEAFA